MHKAILFRTFLLTLQKTYPLGYLIPPSYPLHLAAGCWHSFDLEFHCCSYRIDSYAGQRQYPGSHPETPCPEDILPPEQLTVPSRRRRDQDWLLQEPHFSIPQMHPQNSIAHGDP